MKIVRKREIDGKSSLEAKKKKNHLLSAPVAYPKVIQIVCESQKNIYIMRFFNWEKLHGFTFPCTVNLESTYFLIMCFSNNQHPGLITYVKRYYKFEL